MERYDFCFWARSQVKIYRGISRSNWVYKKANSRVALFKSVILHTTPTGWVLICQSRLPVAGKISLRKTQFHNFRQFKHYTNSDTVVPNIWILKKRKGQTSLINRLQEKFRLKKPGVGGCLKVWKCCCLFCRNFGDILLFERVSLSYPLISGSGKWVLHIGHGAGTKINREQNFLWCLVYSLDFCCFATDIPYKKLKLF